jgi:hypothetical protein
VTDGRSLQWRMVRSIGPAVGQDEATADMAIAYAVERDWLIAAGNPPHSICLTDEGRVWTGRKEKMARSGSDPFPITLPERVNDWSKVGRVLLQWRGDDGWIWPLKCVAAGRTWRP